MRHWANIRKHTQPTEAGTNEGRNWKKIESKEKSKLKIVNVEM